MADFSQAALIPRLGMYALPYATTYPDLAARLATLYRERAAAIPWLPPGWLDQVMALHGAQGNVLVPSPPVSGPNIVPWLVTDDQRAWWQDFADRAKSIITNYAQAKLSSGLQEMDALQQDAAFWDRAYRIAYVLSAPVRGAQAIVDNPLASLSLGTIAVIASIAAYFLVTKRK